MRSAAELRQRWLERLPLMITHTSMYATDGVGCQLLAHTLLDDLLFLDERQQDHTNVRDVIAGYGKLGVVGPFVAMFGKDGKYVAEVASVYAEQFHRLGYLHVDRLLGPEEWDRITTGLRDRFNGRDVRRSEVEASFGPPGIVADRRVLCYVPADGSGWVFIDCFPAHTSRYEPGAGSYAWQRDDDPLVRTVRFPAEDFESGLVLTLYGKVLRWGPGWWLEQPAGLSDEQQAIAAQLRSINAADPSQSLKPPRAYRLGP